jgi:hypothetical protein
MTSNKGIGARLAAKGLASVGREVGLGLFLAQELAVGVVQEDIGQRQAVANSKAVAGQTSFDAAGPPLSVAIVVASSVSSASNISRSWNVS